MPEYPYVTRLDVKYPALELIDVGAEIRAVKDRWFNQTLCKVNDSVVRMGVVQGEYHWHKHIDLDEFFYVVEGRFYIDLEDRVVGARREAHRERDQERAPHRWITVAELGRSCCAS